MSESIRSFVPHESCNATKEELTESGLKVVDDCTICLDAEVLCRVGRHPVSIASVGKLSKPTSPPQQTGATAGDGWTDSLSIADNLARVMCGDKKINAASGVTDFEDMRTAFYVGMGRLRSSSLTTRLSHLWATARHSTENHDDIVTGTKGQLQVESEAPVEFTCLYDCEKTDLAILGCENISNTALHMHEFGNMLYVGQNLKLAGFGQSLERAKPFVPSVKSVNVARTNCSIFDCVGWKSLKFFVVDQVVDFGYSGSPVYHPVNGDVIGMLCGSFEGEFANVSMCLKAIYIGDALADNFILKRKRTFSCL